MKIVVKNNPNAFRRIKNQLIINRTNQFHGSPFFWIRRASLAHHPEQVTNDSEERVEGMFRWLNQIIGPLFPGFKRPVLARAYSRKSTVFRSAKIVIQNNRKI